MKFTIDRTSFLKILTTVNIAVVPKSPTPAYLNFKIDMLSDQLMVTGSNGEMTITSCCHTAENGKTIIVNYEEGSILLSAKFLLEIIRKMDSDTITLEVIDEVMALISNEKSHYKLTAMRAEEYPNIDLSKYGETITFSAEDFKKIISQTAFAASTKEIRPVLTALNVRSNGTNIEFAATDGYRLSKKIYECGSETEINANIPVKTLSEVAKLIEDGDIELTISENKVIFSYKDTTVYSRLINQDFPPTTKMIPTKFIAVLQVNADDFLSAIDRMSVLAVERENIVKLTVSDEECTISSRSEQIGDAQENISEYRYSGGRFEISFNVLYVIDAIRAIQEEDVVISFVSELSGFKISSPTKEDIVEVVTPVHSI